TDQPEAAALAAIAVLGEPGESGDLDPAAEAVRSQAWYEVALARSGRGEDAREAYRASLAASGRVLERYPGTVQMQANHAAVLVEFGYWRIQQGEPGWEELDRAISATETILAEHPDYVS